jgi:hypothetical protein
VPSDALRGQTRMPRTQAKTAKSLRGRLPTTRGRALYGDLDPGSVRRVDALVDRGTAQSADRGVLATTVWWALRVLLVAAILDALTTYVAFARPGTHERNPVALHVIETLGLPGALVVRALTGVGYFLALGWAFRHTDRGVVRVATCIVAVGTAAFWWLVVVNNVAVLAA